MTVTIIRKQPPQTVSPIDLASKLTGDTFKVDMLTVSAPKKEIPRGRGYLGKPKDFSSKPPSSPPRQLRNPDHRQGLPPKPTKHVEVAKPLEIRYNDDDDNFIFYKCEACKDTKRIIVFDECESCYGAGCNKCNNSGDVKHFIKCPECSIKRK